MIRNTTNEDPMVLLVETMGSGGIERQEARGQRELAADSALPTEGLSSLPAEWGITSLGVRDGDPLFTNVQLPDGWKVQPTGHSMWSDLLDADGKKRAAIFYKAAYYDRRAFIRPESNA